jgi:hypothetical protein
MEPDTQAYVAVMEEIKRRTALVYALIDRNILVMFEATHVETMVLQVRMITELIALASLAAHKAIFEVQQKKFEKHWDPVQILKNVERLNPDFYSRPISEIPSQQEGVKSHLVDLQSGFMTREELVEIHGRCGNVLHARNPYGTPLDYEQYGSLVPTWMERIMALLNTHQVRLLDSDTFYLVHMREGRDDQAHMYTFRRADVAGSQASAS